MMWAKISSINIVVFVLIFGISRSTDAERMMKSLCTLNGIPEAYEAAQISLENFGECYRSSMQEMAEAASRIIRSKFGNPNSLLRDAMQDQLDCTKTFTHSIKSCLGPAHDIAYTVSASMIKFYYEHAELTKAFLTSYDRECYDSKEQALQDCADKVIIGRNATIPNDLGMGLGEEDFLPIYMILSDSQKCSKMQFHQECSIGVVNECRDKIFAKMHETLYNYINNDIPCKNLPRTPIRSGSSSTSTVNVLLLVIAAIAISS